MDDGSKVDTRVGHLTCESSIVNPSGPPRRRIARCYWCKGHGKHFQVQDQEGKHEEKKTKKSKVTSARTRTTIRFFR